MFQIAEQLKTSKYELYVNYIDNILKQCSRLIKLADYPEQLLDDMDVNFVGVKKRILDIIQSLVKTHQHDFPLTYKDQIWNIIEYLCYYMDDPDDKREAEYNADPYTLAINSVRGTAIIAVIDYAIMVCFSILKTNILMISIIQIDLIGEERIQKLLDDKLNNKEDDPSLAIHSYLEFI